MSDIDVLEIGESSISISTPDTRLIRIGRRQESYEIRTIDFFINGKNLRALIANNNENAPDNTTNLTYFSREQKSAYVSMLTGEIQGDLDSGRVALLTCPIDGDLACDTVGCRIGQDEEAGTFTWYDFAWDGNHDDAESDDSDEDEYEKVRGLDKFVFDNHKYMELMNKIIESS